MTTTAIRLAIVAALLAFVAFIAHEAPAANGRSARHLRPTVHPCLAAIIDRENTAWDPTVYNRQGSGAYGLPQALPGSKMRSAGSDWRTNPRTQIRWMIGYVNARYGGACNALAFHKRNGWY